MNIQIKENIEIDEIWNNEIFKKNQQTIFLSKKFLDYHPSGRFHNLNLFVYVDDALLLIIPTIQTGKSLFSHSGSTYGGVLQFFDVENKIYLNVINEVKKYLKSRNCESLTFRLPPEDFISDSRNSFLNSIDSFEELYKEEETYVELMNKDFNDLKNSGFRRNHIRDIRKINLIENEIELTKVKNNKDLSDYYLILQENLSKHKVNPTHSKEELQWLLKNFENDIWINILKHKGKIVSGIVLFKMNKKVLHCFYGSVDYNFQYPSVMKYLYWKTMSKAQDEGFKILNFGIDSKFDEKENHNLRLFKAGFGGLHTYRKTVKMWF